MMHIQEERYLWDKFLAEQHSLARRFVYDRIDEMTIELGVLGITTRWQCEGLRDADMWAKILQPSSFINMTVDGGLIDYFKPTDKEEQDDE